MCLTVFAEITAKVFANSSPGFALEPWDQKTPISHLQPWRGCIVVAN